MTRSDYVPTGHDIERFLEIVPKYARRFYGQREQITVSYLAGCLSNIVKHCQFHHEKFVWSAYHKGRAGNLISSAVYCPVIC
jgi:hypothetical protein